MPLGFLPLGFGPLGAPLLDEDAAPRARATYPRALWFDGATRDYALDADGRYRDLHPVDQKVALALLVELGRVTSAPAIGSTIKSVAPNAPTTPAAVEAAVRRALAPMLRAQEIRLRAVPGTTVGIQVESGEHGRLEVAVYYVNLARAATDPARLQSARAAL